MYRIVKTYLPSLFCRHFRCMHNRFSVLFTCDIMKRVEVASLFLWLAFNHILENIADNCNAYVKNFRYTKAVIPLWIYLSTWFAFFPADYELLLLLLMLHAMANDSHCWLRNFVCLRTNRTCRLFSTNYFNTLVKQFFGCFRVFFVVFFQFDIQSALQFRWLQWKKNFEPTFCVHWYTIECI